MNQNPFQREYMGRRDPKVIREENATTVYQNRMQQIHQPKATEPKPTNFVDQELKRRQNDLRVLRNNPMNRKNRPF